MILEVCLGAKQPTQIRTYYFGFEHHNHIPTFSKKKKNPELLSRCWPFFPCTQKMNENGSESSTYSNSDNHSLLISSPFTFHHFHCSKFSTPLFIKSQIPSSIFILIHVPRKYHYST